MVSFGCPCQALNWCGWSRDKEEGPHEMWVRCPAVWPPGEVCVVAFDLRLDKTKLPPSSHWAQSKQADPLCWEARSNLSSKVERASETPVLRDEGLGGRGLPETPQSLRVRLRCLAMYSFQASEDSAKNPSTSTSHQCTQTFYFNFHKWR